MNDIAMNESLYPQSRCVPCSTLYSCAALHDAEYVVDGHRGGELARLERWLCIGI
jgi:hypothetical protein